MAEQHVGFIAAEDEEAASRKLRSGHWWDEQRTVKALMELHPMYKMWKVTFTLEGPI